MTTDCVRSEAEGRWSKYYLAILKEGKGVLYEVTKALYPGGSLRPDVYLMKKHNFTEDDYKEVFVHEQREVISSWPMDVPYDISKAALHQKWDILLHYKLLRKACYIDTYQGRKLFRHLFSLKELRNEVSHSVLDLTQAELERRLSDLKELYSTILRSVGAIKNKNYEKEVENICNKLKQLSRPDSQRKIQEPLKRTLEEKSKLDPEKDFFKQVKSEVLEQCREKRKINPGGMKQYKAVSISDLFSFVKIKVRCSSVTTEKKLRADKILKLMDLKEPHSVVTIIGPAGSGKTTLMLYVMDQWCSESSSMYGIEDVNLLFYIDLSSVRATTVPTLVKECLLPKSLSNIAHRKVVDSLKEWKPLWLLDGFDQCSLSTRRLVKDICDRFSNVIITSRPEYTSTLESFVNEGASISELEVIDLNCAMDIAKRLCLYLYGKKGTDSVVEKFKKFISGTGGMYRGLINSPLHVTRLCLLWLEHQTKNTAIETCIQVHINILSTTLNKVVQRLVRKTGEIRISLEQKMLQFIDVLCQVAWEMIRDNSAYLTKKQVSLLLERCRKLDLFEYHFLILSLFLDPITYQERHKERTTYRFNEKKDMEFLAARHIHSLYKSNENFKLEQALENDKRWSEVVVNLVGIIALEDALSPSISKQIVNFMKGMEYRKHDWLHLLSESMGNANLLEEISFIYGNSKVLVLDGNRLMDNWKTILGLVSHQKFQNVQLKFETEPEDLDATLKRIQVLTIYAQTIAVLCNWSLYDYSSNHVVDSFLNAVSTQGKNLTEFAGHLSPQAIVKKLPMTAVKLSLRLRTPEEANALQTWLKKHPLKDLTLILDFPSSMIPNLLPNLTPTWFVKESGSNTPPGLKVIITRYYDIKREWAEKVLRRLYKGKYSSILLEVGHLTSKDKKPEEDVSMHMEGLPTQSLGEVDEDGMHRVLKEEKVIGDNTTWHVMAMCLIGAFLQYLIGLRFGDEGESYYFLLFIFGLCYILAGPIIEVKRECDKYSKLLQTIILYNHDPYVVEGIWC